MVDYNGHFVVYEIPSVAECHILYVYFYIVCCFSCYWKRNLIWFDLMLYCLRTSLATMTSHVGSLECSARQRANSIHHVNNVTSSQRSKTFYDVNTKTPEITVGSKVLLHYDVVKPGESPKFHSLAKLISSYANQTTDCHTHWDIALLQNNPERLSTLTG